MYSKGNLFALLTVLALLSLGNCQTNTLKSKNSWLTIAPSFFANGVYYVPPFEIYNATSGNVTMFSNLDCDDAFFITANEMIWCLNVGDFQNFSLYQLSADLSQVVGIYKIPGVPRKQDEVSYDYFGNYINFFFTDLYIAFDTYSLEFVCPVYGNKILGYGWFLNSSVISVNGDGDNAMISFNPCTGSKAITTIGVDKGQQGPIFGLNQSTVFVRELFNDNRLYFSSGMFDLTGRFHFGPEAFEASGEPLNDTHIALINPYGVGLYTVGIDLRFHLVSQLAIDINSTLLAIQTIRGSSSVVVYFVGGRFYYDFDQQIIYNVNVDIPTITLNNGSTVNLTVHGYFLQSPGQPISFYKHQSLEFYTNASDSTKIYGFYALNNNGSNNVPCSLLQIDTTLNIINPLEFPDCPVHGAANIHDVVFNQDNIIAVAYTDATQNLHLVTYNQYLGPFNATAGISPIVIGIDLLKMEAYYAGFNYTDDRQFLAGNFSLINNFVNTTSLVQVGTFNNYVIKLSEFYFLVATSYLNGTSSLFTWQAQTMNKFETIQLQSFCNVTGLVALGVSVYNPNIFGEVICQSGSTEYQVISMDGKVKAVNVASGSSLNDITKNGNNSFVLLVENIEFTTQEFYTVSYQ